MSLTEKVFPMRTVLVVLSTLAFAASSAFAADQPPVAGGRAACKADAAALCAGVQPGNHRIAACLKQNEAKVSPACKDAMAQAQDRKAQSKSGPAPQ
jgi:hypothetical protein